jgi:hypothetical protein
MTQIIALVGLLQIELGFDPGVIKQAWEGILQQNPEPSRMRGMTAYHEHKALCWSKLARRFGLIK